MKIIIQSRRELEKMAQKPFKRETAVISITEYNWSFAELRYSPENLLQLQFEDVDGDVFEDVLGKTPTEQERNRIEEKYHMLTDVQAKKIAEFYHAINEKIQILICQCEHGQSRSAAVAAAISEHRFGNGIDIFAEDAYTPNKWVFRKVLKALKQEKGAVIIFDELKEL